MRDGTALYYVKDQIGSIAGVMGPKGASLGSTLYSAYGVVKLSAGAQADFGYAGMLYNSATGLYLTKYREYSSAVGRWLSRDPIGEVAGINLYAYVSLSPVNHRDPYGLQEEEMTPVDLPPIMAKPGERPVPGQLPYTIPTSERPIPEDFMPKDSSGYNKDLDEAMQNFPSKEDLESCHVQPKAPASGLPQMSCAPPQNDCGPN